MKNKLLKAMMLSVIAAALSIQTVCYAIDFTPDGQKYVISGNVEEVSSHMLSLDVSGSDASVHTSYVLTDNNGNFSYSFMLPEGAVAGKYTVKLTDSDIGEVYSYDFVYADDNKKLQIITNLNNAEERKTAEAALKECVEFSMYAYPTGFEMLSEILISIYDRISQTNDFTIENLTDKLREIFAVASLGGATQENVDKVLAEYSQVYQFENEKYYSMYSSFSDTSVVNKMFIKNKFDGLSQIRQIFNEITALHKMCSEESPGGIVKVINECSDIFPSDVTSLSNAEKLKLGTSLLGKTINSMTEMETAVSNMKNNNGGGQGGSGGGGSTGNKNSSTTSTSSGFVSGVAIPVSQETGEKLKYEFADLRDAEWAREAVYALSNKEIISGYVDGDFRPNNNITREEFVKIIVCAFKLNTFGSGNSFADVPQGHWGESYISSASRSGIVGGVGNGEFGLGQNITRQDMAVIIYNALKVSGKARNFELTGNFSDEGNIAEYAKNAVNALKAYDITTGYTDGTFLPQNNATSAEAAQLIYKVLQFADMI